MTPDELTAARKSLDLTQDSLGKILGMTRFQIIRLEAGTSPIKPIYAREVQRLLSEQE